MGHASGDILKALIRIGGSPGECWEWLGKVSKTGYGCKQWHGKTVLAHRWVYQIFNGHIAQNGVINHLCSNRKCVNPNHLEVTTTAGNCRHGAGSKLTVTQVIEIKNALAHAKWGERKTIAHRYGVSPALISDIKFGRAWADV